MVLKALGDGAGVGTVINLKVVGNAVVVEDIVQLAGIDSQAVLVTHIDSYCAISGP